MGLLEVGAWLMLLKELLLGQTVDVSLLGLVRWFKQKRLAAAIQSAAAAAEADSIAITLHPWPSVADSKPQ